MTFVTFDAHELSPQRVFRREALPGDQAWPQYRRVTPRDLRGKGQELFVDAVLRKEISQQARPTLNQDQIARPAPEYSAQDRASRQLAGAFRFDDLHRRRELR